jgi:hypothetical protein
MVMEKERRQKGGSGSEAMRCAADGGLCTVCCVRCQGG